MSSCSKTPICMADVEILLCLEFYLSLFFLFVYFFNYCRLILQHSSGVSFTEKLQLVPLLLVAFIV